MQINMTSLRLYVKDTWVFYQARDSYYTGILKDIEIYKNMDGYKIKGVFAQYYRKIKTFVNVDLNGHINSGKCDCSKSSTKKGCVHIVALCEAVNEINPESFPYKINYQDYLEMKQRERELEIKRQINESNNIELEKMIHAKLEKRMESLLSAKDETIHMRVFLEKNPYPNINFSIGTKKLYKVKNITELSQGFSNSKVYNLGKTSSIVLKRKNLDEYSSMILDFINQNILDVESNKKYLDLYSSNFDEFYSLIEQLPFDYYNFLIEDQDIRIRFDIQKIDEMYDINPIFEQNYYKGKKHLYSIKETTLIRYKLDEYGQLISLIDFLYKYEDLMINKENMKQIYLQMIQPNLSLIDLHTNFDPSIFEENIQDITIYSDLQDNELKVWGNYKNNGETKQLFEENQSYCIQSIEAIIKNYASKVENHIACFKTRGQRLDEFLDTGIPLLTEQATVMVSEELKRLKERKSLNLNVGVQIQNNLLEMRIETDGISREELIQILNAYRKKKKFFRLKNGDTLDLESKEIKELDDLATQLDLSTKDLKKEEIVKPAYQSFHLDSVDLDIRKDESIDRYLNRLDSLKSVELNEKYNSLLREYQKEGINWISHLNTIGLNGILADDMGLGKTLQVLVYLEGYKTKKPHLIVCPSSLMYNWKNEIHKFNIQMDCICVTGNQMERKNLIEEKHDLYITTYDYLKRDIEFYLKKKFEYVILDEAQYIKNPKTQNAQSVKSLKCEHRLALTGTPIENSLSELWSIFDFLMPGYLYSLAHFVKQYEKPIRIENDEEKQRQLQKLVSPFILRRTKQQVLKDLPDKVEKELWLDFNEEEKKLYLVNLARANDELKKQFELEQVDSILILALMTRLRQICCDARMVFDNFNYPTTKMNICLDLIETLKENQKKVLLFSSFTTIFDYMIPELEQRGIKYHIITGQTTKEKRAKEVKEFQEDDSDVFLISLKAGGTGLNLTSAQAVIHFDPWWNVSAQNQATDRAYRIGQTKNVLVYQLLIKGSIEEKIFEMQKSKKEMSDIFVEGAKGSISSLSKTELKELFTMK